jgi:hypothetical protein
LQERFCYTTETDPLRNQLPRAIDQNKAHTATERENERGW